MTTCIVNCLLLCADGGICNLSAHTTSLLYFSYQHIIRADKHPNNKLMMLTISSSQFLYTYSCTHIIKFTFTDSVHMYMCTVLFIYVQND